MPVKIIDTIKPKNNSTFPVVEAVDVAVTEELRLPEALAAKADVSALSAKADAAQTLETTTSLQNQINNIVSPVTEDAEVINARVDANGSTHTTLKDRLDSEDVAARKVAKNILDSCDLDTLTGNNTYFLADSKTYEHSPLSYGMLATYELYGSWKMQILYAFGGHGVYKRNMSGSSVWSDWILIEAVPENQLGTNTDRTISQNFLTLNTSGFARSAAEFASVDGGTTYLALSDIKKPGYYVISTTWTITDAPYGASVTGVKVEKYAIGDEQRFLKQTVECVGSNGDYYSYFRYTNVSGTYLNWVPCGRKGFMYAENALLASCDLNDLTTTSTWLMVDSQTYENAPYYDSRGKTVGVLSQYTLTNGWFFQIWYSFTEPDVYKRIGKSNSWNAWMKISSGSGSEITYEVTQNINRDEITNTYNITTTPTITTDSNGWLQAIDTDTSSETGKTDMSGAIISMLNETGYCHLAPGVFYVSGFDMPEGSTIEGCGKKTILRLLSSVNSGYTCRIGRNCTVKNICFSGGYSAPSDVTTEGADLGSRHGIYLVANADGEETSAPSTYTNIVEGCFFENYDGSAYYNRNTGYGLDDSVIMSDCRIKNCKVGINIDYFGEYGKYSNIIISHCNYACINNGGNNVFSSCTFHGVVGFLIDDSASDKKNNSHGSCIGCVFNHVDSMNNPTQHGMGYGIVSKGADSGFIFSGCQIWYSKVNIENSRGIAIQNSLFGGNSPTIAVNGTYPAFIQNCVFMDSPTLSLNSGTKLDSCYLARTGAPIINPGEENMMTVTSGSSVPPTRWIDIPVSVSAGGYRVSFDTLTSNDTDASTCQAIFMDSGNNTVSAWIMLERGSNVSAFATVTSAATVLRLYASDTYAHSEGDTVTYTGGAIYAGSV